MKTLFRNIHLYLGLAAGLVIMSCCFSGAVLVFEKELQEAIHHDRYFVKQSSLQLPVERLISNVKEKYPGAKVASVKRYTDPLRSVEVSVSFPGKANEKHGDIGRLQSSNERKDIKITGEVNPPGNIETADSNNRRPGRAVQEHPTGARPTHTAFVNPYTGEVLELYAYRDTFFYTMFSLHRWLLGSESSIGKTITGVATLIFIFILITGIILWWPRNKAILKQRLKIKTTASWKRVNHDLHIVLGFYSAIFLFILSFTALAWSFKWFNNGIYAVTGSSMQPAEPPHSVAATNMRRITFDSAFISISNLISDVQYYSLRAPSDSAGAFSATVLPINAHESASDNYYIDQYTGRVIGALKYKDKNLGQRIRSTFKPVHVGSIFGWPSKVVAFLVCVLGFTFPVTGVIMWINRLKKNRRTTAITKPRLAMAANKEDET